MPCYVLLNCLHLKYIFSSLKVNYVMQILNMRILHVKSKLCDADIKHAFTLGPYSMVANTHLTTFYQN
jgi:hypothetical protein